MSESPFADRQAQRFRDQIRDAVARERLAKPNARTILQIMLIDEAEAALDEIESLRHALLSFLEWARRFQGGDESLNPEEYYIARDYAQVVLDRTSTSSRAPAAATEEGPR